MKKKKESKVFSIQTKTKLLPPPSLVRYKNIKYHHFFLLFLNLLFYFLHLVLI
jgi:hypothetical protein